jgi:seryl-tRNA synthetase
LTEFVLLKDTFRDELVEGKQFYVPAKDAVGLVKAMERFIMQLNLIKRMGYCSLEFPIKSMM